MKRILFDVPRWDAMMHRYERGMSRPRDTDDKFLRIEDELFEKLYTGGADPLPADDVDPQLKDWAESFHNTCDALPDFARLAKECRGDAAAAAQAVETILDELEDIPEPKEDAQQPGGNGPRPTGTVPDQKTFRRDLQKAVLAASQAVEEFRDIAEGMAQVSFGRAPGRGGNDCSPDPENPRTRPLAKLLRNDARLRRIALLAGRFKRIAAAKRRQRVHAGQDEITSIEQGDALSRALPAELAKLAHSRLRLSFMRALLERQLLQYQLEGSDNLGRGPLVLLVDKSSSMKGDEDLWATAVTIALLDHAHHDRRPFAVIQFQDGVVCEHVVMPADQLPKDALFTACSGGTDIAAAVTRGLTLITAHTPESARLSRADLVLITDGGSDTEQAASLKNLAAQRNISILGIGIGVGEDMLTPWCDHVETISSLKTLDEKTAAALFSAA